MWKNVENENTCEWEENCDNASELANRERERENKLCGWTFWVRENFAAAKENDDKFVSVFPLTFHITLCVFWFIFLDDWLISEIHSWFFCFV